MSRIIPQHTRLGAWVHQLVHRSRHKTVIDEKVFFNSELCVARFEIAGAIIIDALTKNQILSARWCTNWIGLHKSHAGKCALQRNRIGKVSRDCEATEIFEGCFHFWSAAAERSAD